MIPLISLKRRFFVLGQPYELWDNPDHPFGWQADDLRRYADEGRWDALFNALVLRSFTANLALE